MKRNVNNRNEKRSKKKKWRFYHLFRYAVIFYFSLKDIWKLMLFVKVLIS